VSETHAANSDIGSHSLGEIEAVIRRLQVTRTPAFPFVGVADSLALRCA